MNRFVYAAKAEEFIHTLDSGSVHLLAIDPPYYNTVADGWDRQWKSVAEYGDWFVDSVLIPAYNKLAPDGSLVMFGAIGKHGERPLFTVMSLLETVTGYTYRNLITWAKRRAYGKSHDYLFCREEIVWYSKSAERTEVRFNIPLTDVKRGYEGFNPKYPAKSEYKRVSNVWTDVPELMRPERSCQKPLPLLARIIETHSMPGDLVVDCFAGWGTTGIAALQAGRRFIGCEANAADANAADARCSAVTLREVA